MSKQKEIVFLQWTAIGTEKIFFQNKWMLIISGCASIVMVIMGILTKDAIIAITFGALALVCFMFIFQKPRRQKVVINEAGIKVDDKLYSFEELESFWIIEKEEEKILQLKTVRTILPFVPISLGDQNSKIVREILLNYLPEKKETESFIDI